MIQKCDLAATIYSFEDALLMEQAQKLNIQFSEVPTYSYIHKMLNLDTVGAKALLKKFSQADRDRDGQLDWKELMQIFSGDIDFATNEIFLRDLFEVFDQEHCCTISFRDFISG
jgi:Ca2+-binding EF-hand superfamily protein